MDGEIRITGLEDTLAKLDGLPRRVVAVGYARALTAAAVPIVKELEIRAPQDTGDMKRRLVTDVALDPAGRGGRAQIGFGKAGYKARLVEYGHRMVSHKPNKKEIGTVAPHPFMRPAAAAAADKAVEAFAASLADTIDNGI